MREMKEKFIKEFIALGKDVQLDGETLRPNTKVNVVIGKVATLEETGKNNLKATIKVAGAKFNFSGFVNDNTPVSTLLKQAKEKEVAIPIRLEKKRKKTADPKADITAITKDAFTAKDNVVNIIAGVYNMTTNEWILTDDAASNPDEDPTYVAAEMKSASYSTEGFFQSDAPKITTTDKDWKANHLVSMFTYASEHSFENEIALKPAELKILATYMLKAVDQLQMRAKKIQAPNYNDYSHTKARGILFSWMRVNPLSKEVMTTPGEFNKWISRFLEESTEIWNWANEEVNKEQ